MNPIYQIVAGSFLLSLIHASVPNHWLPLVVIGKTEKWSCAQTLGVTAIAGLAHTASTLIIGILVGWLGYQLASHHALITGMIAPVILIVLGLLYLVTDQRSSRHNHHQSHQIPMPQDNSRIPPQAGRVITSLVVAMFFSPCLEIEAYYFTAGALGSFGIVTVSVIYLFVTMLGMLLLVDLGRHSVEKIRLDFLEHHEKGVTGMVLIVLGVLAYLFFA